MTDFDDLIMAFDFVSFSAPSENMAYLCKETGVIYWHSEYDDNEEELPDDIGSDRYIEVPHKNELDLGKPLVMRFAAEFLSDEEHDKAREIFSRRGAYSRFKELLERSGKLQQWYDYETKAQHEALRKWCQVNGIEIDE